MIEAKTDPRDAAGRLPEPGPDAAAHSARLVEHIRGQIDSAGGAIPFSRFMELALYAPALGYYTAGAHKLGAGGDFVTAPELSPLFGRCVARQCAQVLEGNGGDILEFGAGSGALAAQVLSELEALGVHPGRYRILEVSADLRARQQSLLEQRVPQWVERVEWLDGLPARHRGVLLANEVLDAMPVERFRIHQGRVEQAHVCWAEGGLAMAYRRAPEWLEARVRAVESALGRALEEGYTSELSASIGPWLHTLGAVLDTGAALIIDYGYPRAEYYHPQRREGTLMCHYRHRAHADPLVRVGLQDLTASVDFTLAAEAASDAGLEVAGFTTQAHFLMASGLDRIMGEADPDDTVQYLELARQAKLLTLPGEMGERFKVLGLTRGLDTPLMGFALRDLRHAL